jgi:hypothetical protein
VLDVSPAPSKRLAEEKLVRERAAHAMRDDDDRPPLVERARIFDEAREGGEVAGALRGRVAARRDGVAEVVRRAEQALCQDTTGELARTVGSKLEFE